MLRKTKAGAQACTPTSLLQHLPKPTRITINRAGISSNGEKRKDKDEIKSRARNIHKNK